MRAVKVEPPHPIVANTRGIIIRKSIVLLPSASLTTQAVTSLAPLRWASLICPGGVRSTAGRYNRAGT